MSFATVSRARGTGPYYEEWLENHLPHFDVLSVTAETTIAYADLRVALKRVGRPIPANDAWIAALAIEHRLPVFSRDTHFRLDTWASKDRLVDEPLTADPAGEQEHDEGKWRRLPIHARLRIAQGQRCGDRFERTPLRIDREKRRDKSSGEHQAAAERIADEHVGARAAGNQVSEHDRPSDTAESRAEGVEPGDRAGSHFEREVLADGEIGRARRCRGEEEHDAPGERLRERVQDFGPEQHAGRNDERAGQCVGCGDHDAPPEVVEQRSQQQRSEEVTGCERQKK